MLQERCGFRNEVGMVEVMRRYSNPPGMASELGELLEGPPPRNTSDMETAPALVQSQRRLRLHDVARLVADYFAGATIDNLAAAYGVNRTTVNAHLDRAGAARPVRRGKLSERQVRQAGRAHRDGVRITELAVELGVSEETLRRALRRVGTPR